ncbi:hypothetical protein R1flu_025184 [Riccia fluitans]|uniref:Uncharacterized protein n=1 Tax=Riccia fluitans TaxID=41844 RepID=A0ABD1XX10_9MARC
MRSKGGVTNYEDMTTCFPSTMLFHDYRVNILMQWTRRGSVEKLKSAVQLFEVASTNPAGLLYLPKAKRSAA